MARRCKLHYGAHVYYCKRGDREVQVTISDSGAFLIDGCLMTYVSSELCCIDGTNLVRVSEGRLNLISNDR